MLTVAGNFTRCTSVQGRRGVRAVGHDGRIAVDHHAGTGRRRPRAQRQAAADCTQHAHAHALLPTFGGCGNPARIQLQRLERAAAAQRTPKPVADKIRAALLKTCRAEIKDAIEKQVRK